VVCDAYPTLSRKNHRHFGITEQAVQGDRRDHIELFTPHVPCRRPEPELPAKTSCAMSLFMFFASQVACATHRPYFTVTALLAGLNWDASNWR
jgi:hypothetical protein